jgi:rfaE bifunctional protein kinase chain/domain
MSKAGPSSNQPEPSEHHKDSQESSPEESGIHHRFLEDISKFKHIPEITNEAQARNGLLEALLSINLGRTINDSSREFRILGLNFINRSVYMGLSKQLGQMPFLSLFKGEIRNIQHEQEVEKLSLRLGLIQQKDKIDKDKIAKETSKIQDRVGKIKDKKDLEDSENEDLLVDSLLERDKPERAMDQDFERQTINREYDIINEIRKATEFELSNLSASEHQNTLFQQLEQLQSHDLASKSSTDDSTTISIARLKECLSKFSQGKILVVGDLLIDELLEGSPERISREAPVLILEHVDTTLIPGGAANAAHNVTALGGQCHTIGVCGEDDYAKKLANLLESHKITHDLIADSSRPTTVKTRIIAKNHALMQQLLRLDRISHDTIGSTIAKRLIAKLESVAKNYPLLVLSDYRAGIMTDEIIRACQKLASEHNFKLIVDAQDNFERFQNVSLITPNQPDTEKTVGYKINNESDLLQAGKDMLLLTGAQSVLITRGKDGMVLFEHGKKPFSLPAFNRSEIYDVSGAGDTVVASIALGMATGASMAESVTLGNVAASIVVKKPGTAVTNQEEVLSALSDNEGLINRLASH